MTTYSIKSNAPVINAATDPDPGDTVVYASVNGVSMPSGGSVTVTTVYGDVKIYENPVTNPMEFIASGTAGFPADQANLVVAQIPYVLTDGTNQSTGTITVELEGQVAAPPPVPISNGTPPTILGLQASGSTLTVSDLGTWTGIGTITYAYQWKSDGANVGTNSNTYVTVSGDIGKVITCDVTGTDSTPTSATATSNGIGVTPVPLINTQAPSITGSPIVGSTLTRVAGVWTGTGTVSLTYQWLRDGSNISGATGTSYALQAADEGHAISVRETANDGVNSPDTEDSASITCQASGGALPLSYFLPDATDRTRRAEIVADHFPGTNQDFEFTGFASTSGFTTQTATSMADLAQKIGALSASANVVMECAWNGVSSSSASFNGTTSASLSANGAIDYGYTRHTQKILIKPATGFSPIMQGTATASGSAAGTATVWYGMNFLEFRDMKFQTTQIQFTSNSTRPTPACVAFNGCTFTDGPGSNGAFRVIPGIRSAHFENCIWDGCRCGYSGATNFLRIWNCVNINHADNDFISNRGYAGYALQWRARAWIAGLMLYSPSQTAFPGASGNHLDIMQVSTTATAGNVAEHDILYEFCIGYANRANTCGATQGLFGDDGTATGPYSWMVHNSINCLGGNKAMTPFDPLDDGTKIMTRLTLCRIGNGSGATTTGTRNDNGMLLQGVKKRAGQGSGRFTVKDCIYGVSISTTGVVANDTRTNVLDCNPKKGAAVGVRMQDTFAGNGSWFQNPTDNEWQYDIGDQGQTPTVAKQLIRDFFVPIRGPQGSGYASAAGHVGTTDPNLWPTDFRNLS